MNGNTILNLGAGLLGLAGVAVMLKGCADPMWGKDVNTTYVVGLTLVFFSATLSIIAHSRRHRSRTVAESIGKPRLLHLIAFPFYLFAAFAAWQTFGNRSESFRTEVIFTVALLTIAIALSYGAVFQKWKIKKGHSNQAPDTARKLADPQR